MISKWLSDPVVLVGGDGGELGLAEEERFEILAATHVLALGVDVDHVEAWLVLVHGVQNDLRGEGGVEGWLEG